MSDASTGSLYVVATPIGNLEDLSPRAARVLGEVALVAAEDTRHTSRLLRHLGIAPAVVSLHEHNEAGRVEQIDARLAAGEDVALVSDAGTPLISDPGFVLVRELRARGRRVTPVPGACALVAALSAAGLATDRFLFNGFLPAKGGARRARLEALVEREESLVFYESPHRIEATLADLSTVFGERRLVLARELTKTFETFLDGSADELIARLEADPDQARGEFVVMVEGAAPREVGETATLEADALLASLLAEGVGVKQAAGAAARLLGGAKKTWYARAQQLKDGD
ncbi:16S rRNA (cytidine(1402)-2'-O)-methyltransferase [Halomonas elongata]|uniref:Ribosomal RNA small subunit methyltransferase I n=1 Tax=Halomonas elongata (strain ATCC 33173 / DSM 2581 / NBRC 15536 / NCIMB 2198 / 1H9) TaxID=768066 RepID=E1V9K2_HALED|nr:16S rRNA (cytidine(1402)-2'-O)-methyltransferase [Halomonas elongata]MBW5798544.1 16S rRNA (cytidine(1402)-2'-O)-methyltransferase [Halomonas elongata]MDL4862810.1 16S rRNA (cytidine(1402)-2'-O)-methyltransferase [Halomonas elongata]RAW08162.1 16S rRNA (cytidine(1402)-2'-O)-methyltransferase [Halomonas elongata]WBF19081.1 16S rRNA (cytidine(1402)-2'-O)-methyltransferase [Halomonas elongata]WPU47940.1 16S rRNA (cytidine(1402)-2'-O)-methyltransferase [Halomonas elongata DSM 2581]